MAEVVQGLLFRARSNTGAATRDLRGVVSVMADLNGALALVQRGLRGMTAIFREGVGASIEQERVFLRLDRALRGLGTTYAENQQRLSSYFAEVQRTTRFGDDVTAEVMGRVATATRALGVGADQLEEMTSLVLDYAEATGRDAVASSRQLSQVFAGNVEMLSRMLPAYRDTIREISALEDPAERAAAAVGLLTQEFGGAAANIDPLDLALSRITNGFGDVREALGDLVRESPAIQAVFSGIADTVDWLAAALGGAGEGADGFRLSLEDLLVGGTSYIRALGEQLVNLWRLARTISLEAQNLGGFGAGEERRRNERLNEATRSISAALEEPGGAFNAVPALRQAERRGVVPGGTADEIDALVGGSSSQRRQAQERARAVLAELERQRESSGFRLGAQVEEEQEIDAALRDLALSVGRGGVILDASGQPLFTPRDRDDTDDTEPTGGGGSAATDPASAFGAAMRGVGGAAQAGSRASALKAKPEQIARRSMFDLDDGKLSDSQRMIVSMYDAMSDSAASFWDLAGSGAERASEILAAYGERMAETQAIADEFGAAMQTMVGDAAAAALTDLTDSIIAGGDSMEGFGERVLANLGRMARGIGATYIATGIPMLLPGPLMNPVAGAAYLKYGGILMAGGTLTGMIGGGGGGGGAGGGSSTPETAMRSQSQARQIERTTVEATYIDTVVTSDERTYRMLSGQINRQEQLGTGRF